MAILKDLIHSFDALWPPASAEDWDRPGLMLGSAGDEITRAMLSVDITAEVIRDGLEQQCQLLVSHHPMLLRPVHELSAESAKGNIVQAAIKGNLAIFAAHTNADVASDGVSESLAKALGLTNLEPLDSASGHGQIGTVQTQSLLDFSRSIAKSLPSTAGGIRVAGDPQRQISSVGLVAGAGDGFLNQALESNIDLFITSDLRHHPAQDFLEASAAQGGPALIDISHWAAEWMWLEQAKSQLQHLQPGVEWLVSDLRTDPWDFTVMQ